ncbi:helix-turn-helix domain-containing protein [Parapedobacter sp. 2B3]|uniref:helix-turn-helix domain-containing protein n=1 Tax=Parapedobacter sp. 2B3 TaxID=3342381 RepID=UPI0035B6181F
MYQKNLVQFLKNKFCSPYKVGGKQVTRNVYAEKCDVARATLTRITNGDGYDVPISTIYKLCTFEDITVKDFFTEFSKWLKSREDV